MLSLWDSLFNHHPDRWEEESLFVLVTLDGTTQLARQLSYSRYHTTSACSQIQVIFYELNYLIQAYKVYSKHFIPEVKNEVDI